MYPTRIVLAVAAVWTLGGSSTALADNRHLVVIRPAAASEQDGLTYGQLSALWWRTMLAIPVEHNPTFDLTGANCNRGATAHFTFLAGQGTGDPVSRTCAVAADKPLFLPLLNVECSNIEAAPFFGATDAARALCARQIMDGVGIATLKVTLDGVEVHNLVRFRAASPPFNFTIPLNDNILPVNRVTTGRSASDGFWVLLRAPEAGSHVIHFEAAFVTGVGAGFSQNVTYNLVVRGDDG
jgi:hypothetical protein